MRIRLDNRRAEAVILALSDLGKGVSLPVKARAVSRVVGCSYPDACSLLSQMRRKRVRKMDVERAVADQWERRPDLYL